MSINPPSGTSGKSNNDSTKTKKAVPLTQYLEEFPTSTPGKSTRAPSDPGNKTSQKSSSKKGSSKVAPTQSQSTRVGGVGVGGLSGKTGPKSGKTAPKSKSGTTEQKSGGGSSKSKSASSKPVTSQATSGKSNIPAILLDGPKKPSSAGKPGSAPKMPPPEVPGGMSLKPGVEESPDIGITEEAIEELKAQASKLYSSCPFRLRMVGAGGKVGNWSSLTKGSKRNKTTGGSGRGSNGRMKAPVLLPSMGSGHGVSLPCGKDLARFFEWLNMDGNQSFWYLNVAALILVFALNKTRK